MDNAVTWRVKSDRTDGPKPGGASDEDEETHFADIVAINASVLSHIAEKAAKIAAVVHLKMAQTDRSTKQFLKVHREFVRNGFRNLPKFSINTLGNSTRKV